MHPCRFCMSLHRSILAICAYIARDIAALCIHMFRAHGYRNLARHYITNNTCAACLRIFATRDRCFKHLAYDSPKCFGLLKSVYLPLSVETVGELDTQAVAVRKEQSKTREPLASVKRAAGPLINESLSSQGLIQFS